jgi:hypothetical protein
LNPILLFTKFLKNKSMAQLISIGQACRLDGYGLCVRLGSHPHQVHEFERSTVEKRGPKAAAQPVIIENT